MISKRDLDKVKRKLRHGSIDAGGCMCSFFILDSVRGFKVWDMDFESVAIQQHRLQTMAAEVGLGPQVLSDLIQFKVRHNENYSFMYVGFVTERVIDTWADRYGCFEFEGWDSCYSNVPDDVEHVCIELDAHGIMWNEDAHAANFGFLADDTLVCIDFGNE